MRVHIHALIILLPLKVTSDSCGLYPVGKCSLGDTCLLVFISIQAKIDGRHHAVRLEMGHRYALPMDW